MSKTAQDSPPERTVARWRALAALGDPRFRRYVPTLISEGMGAQIQQAAILWQIFELTSSPLQLGLTGLAEGIPIHVSVLENVVAHGVDTPEDVARVEALLARGGAR